MSATYVDSSGLVKLAIEEPESAALRRHLRRRRPLVSSSLSRTEVLRALLLEGEPGLTRGHAVLARIELLRVSYRVLSAAGVLPVALRSLDAIHLATAHQLGADLGEMVTYDARMLEAAESVGIRTVSPA